MKFLIYNIAYGTGSPGAEFKRALTSHRYLAAPERPFRKIVNFIAAQNPEVVGLIEADSGSFRTGGVNQINHLADALGHYRFYCSKYAPDSRLARLPYWRHQGNALLTSVPDCVNEFKFLPRGNKRLIISTKVNGITFLLTHLALTRQIRRIQLEYLRELVVAGEPTVVAGDFNTFRGESELARFMEASGLRNANAGGGPTYPVWQPKKQLDYILLSPEIELQSFHIPKVHFSDHLPLVAEITLK